MKVAYLVRSNYSTWRLSCRTNRKILEVLRPVVGELLETWEDWLPQVAASINSSVCAPTGQSPHYVLFGVDKRLPYELLSSTHSLGYTTVDEVAALDAAGGITCRLVDTVK